MGNVFALANISIIDKQVAKVFISYRGIWVLQDFLTLYTVISHLHLDLTRGDLTQNHSAGSRNVGEPIVWRTSAAVEGPSKN